MDSLPDTSSRISGEQLVVPGFVDIHVHGGGGGSYTTGDPIDARRAVAFHRSRGTTTTLASLVTAPGGELLRSVAILAELVDDGLLTGIHLEGPWLSERRHDVHNVAQLLDPDQGELRGDLAWGAVATHMFNAMRPIHHRQPGPIPALLESADVVVELVHDGTHLHPAIYRFVVERVGSERVALVTDAMAAPEWPTGRTARFPHRRGRGGGGQGGRNRDARRRHGHHGPALP